MNPEVQARHDGRWPWCSLTDGHTHTDQLNGPPLVNGRPAGPMTELRQRPELPEPDPLLLIAAGWRS